MTTGLVSIIVAAYNAGSLLPRCLDSLLSQTYRNLEIIVINDASTDNTQDIIDTYRAKDSRIVTLSMPVNSGAPAARNEGMKHTSGEFMTMIDADDEIAENTIELCVNDFLENPKLDFVTFDLYLVDSETNRKTAFRTNPQVPCLMTGEEACYWSILYDFAPNGMSRSPLEQDMPALAEYGQHSDETVTHLILLNARYVKLGKGRYYYYQMPSSVTHRVSVRRLEILDSRLLLRKQLEERKVSDKILLRLEKRRWKEFISMCYFYWNNRKQLTSEEQCYAKRKLRETYATFSWRRLPVGTVLKPRFMMLPSFGMFYMQPRTVFTLKLIHICP